jgi:hypothetical protein
VDLDPEVVPDPVREEGVSVALRERLLRRDADEARFGQDPCDPPVGLEVYVEVRPPGVAARARSCSRVSIARTSAAKRASAPGTVVVRVMSHA